MSHVTAGDRAWEAGDRRRARAEWVKAADSSHPATRAMAEARLLRVSGNIGLATHGPRRDAALSRCPQGVDWCALAQVDAELYGAALGLPADLTRAGRLLAQVDEAELASEVGRRETWLETGVPTSAGTWVLGVGPVGASGLGFGAAAVFRHPDLGLRGHQLSAHAGGTTSGNIVAGAIVDTWGTIGLHAEAAGQHAEVELYEASDTVRRTRWTALSTTAAPKLGSRRAGAWLGPTLWRDSAGSARWTSPGARGAAWWTTDAGTRIFGEATAMGADHQLVYGTVDLRSPPKAAGPALRLAVTPTFAAEHTPTWRRPGWGGGEMLRQGAWARFRAPWLVGTVAEWRQPLHGPLHGAVFGELAWADRPVAGGGAGLRLALPPHPSATVRLDVAHGTGGLGISAGWGAAF